MSEGSQNGRRMDLRLLPSFNVSRISHTVPVCTNTVCTVCVFNFSRVDVGKKCDAGPHRATPTNSNSARLSTHDGRSCSRSGSGGVSRSRADCERNPRLEGESCQGATRERRRLAAVSNSGGSWIFEFGNVSTIDCHVLIRAICCFKRRNACLHRSNEGRIGTCHCKL